MLKVAIIGSGPAGYYTAEGLLKQFGSAVEVDIIDKLPTPFGLIRNGVAPDHQSIKAVTRRYEGTQLSGSVRFFGNVEVGDALTIDELCGLYHAVVLATGAPVDRPLGIAGDRIPGVIGAGAFVGWYNGHPEYAELSPPLDTEAVAIIGNGNVALDVARVLVKTPSEMAQSDLTRHAAAAIHKSPIRDIYIFGRRGPPQVNFTPKELGELGELEAAVPLVRAEQMPPEGAEAQVADPGLKKVMALLRQFTSRSRNEKPKGIHFEFYARPQAVLGSIRAEGLRLERTRLDEDAHAIGTGETFDLPAGLIISCIGYRTRAIAGVPFDNERGRFVNDDGFIAPGLYCVGWSRRGPTGTIGTNRPDGFVIAEKIAAANYSGKRAGRAGLEQLLKERDLWAVTFDDWKDIDAAEIARARIGAPREKFVHIDEMLDIVAHRHLDGSRPKPAKAAGSREAGRGAAEPPSRAISDQGG